MEWRPGCTFAALERRAQLFATIRSFFADRRVVEVDTPLLARYGVTDPAIEPIVAISARGNAIGGSTRFLQSSPEFAMKRLLAAGCGPIYQLGKAFRSGESGARHNPEFTLLEWYRPGFDLQELMDEVAALVRCCLGASVPLSEISLTYEEAFAAATGLDPHRADVSDLSAVAASFTDTKGLDLDRDAWLDLLMTHVVEPDLRGRGLVFIHAYPPSQAALARCTGPEGFERAERFELYLDGIELANGYRELIDAKVLIDRAREDNRRRRAAKLQERTLDPRLIAAMEIGLPDCSGVALGVDRLMMAATGAASMDEVMPFSWGRA